MLRKRVPVSHLFNHFFCYITVPSFEMLKLPSQRQKDKTGCHQTSPVESTEADTKQWRGPGALPRTAWPVHRASVWTGRTAGEAVFPEDPAQRPCQMKAFSSIRKLVGQLGSFCSLPFHITTVPESKYNIHQLCFWWMLLTSSHSKLL